MSERYEKLRKERRFVVVPVDVLLFGETLLNGTRQYKADGLPKDALFVTAEKDITSQTFNFIYLHETFNKVPAKS